MSLEHACAVITRSKRNKVTKYDVEIGNCCVKKFLNLPSGKIFNAIKRINTDSSKSLNIEALEFAKQNNWINDWEWEFYTDTFRKRKLSYKQETKRQQINQKVLLRIERNQ